MTKSRAAVFIKWIVFEKSTKYPKLSTEITTNEAFPRREKNVPTLREFIEELNDKETLSEFNQAWNEYRTIPRISKLTELKALLPGGHRY